MGMSEPFVLGGKSASHGFLTQLQNFDAPNWKISFGIKLFEKLTSPSNILDFLEYGRIPSILMDISIPAGSTSMKFSFTNSKNEIESASTEELDLNQFYEVEIEEAFLDPNYVIIITFDHKTLLFFESPSRPSFESLYLFMSDKWNVPAKAVIRNFIFKK